ESGERSSARSKRPTKPSLAAKDSHTMVRKACSVWVFCLTTSSNLLWSCPKGTRNRSPEADGSLSESDRKSSRRRPHTKIYKVVINFDAKIPMSAIANALSGHETKHF
ncbi:argonaute family protein, partial [Striga asiatica]